MADRYEGTADDPLADEAERPVGPNGCTNPRCEGGWVTVHPGYGDKYVTAPDEELLAGLTDAERVQVQQLVEGMRRSLDSSVYPCRACKPRQFFRWAGGHWSKDHDPASCTECIEVMGAKAARRQHAHHVA